MVIQGWDLGLPQIKQGSKVFLEIPYNLAYGDAGNPVIPAKSDLIFHIELESINNK
jgi:FKBP-type peptidyl-prolyl cis-trans isomerase